jgi:hypothetical protein
MRFPILVPAISRLERRARDAGLPRSWHVAFARPLAAIIAVAVVANCSSPTESLPPELTGRWTLVAVDGQALPVELDVGAQLVGGDLQLSADGSYWNQTRANIGSAMVHGWSEGRWSVSGGQITLRPNGQSEAISAKWGGTYIEIVDSRSLQYKRPVTLGSVGKTDSAFSGRQPRR